MAYGFAKVIENARQYKADAQIAGVLVQEMVSGGRELILGMTQDPAYGPAIAVGLGGIFVEVLKDVAIGVPPLTERDSRVMLGGLRGAAILEGARGAGPADTETRRGHSRQVLATLPRPARQRRGNRHQPAARLRPGRGRAGGGLLDRAAHEWGAMNVSSEVGLFADVHGTIATLREALAACRAEGVRTIALLGDLLDRTEQADACAEALAGWEVVGVYGNHEREIALAAARGAVDLREETIRLLSGLQEEVTIGDVLLTHERSSGGTIRVRSRGSFITARHTAHEAKARITFAGHTHFRQVRDERGTIDIARGRLVLDPRRRYLINPGALAAGQFAIWDRTTQVIQFRQIEW